MSRRLLLLTVGPQCFLTEAFPVLNLETVCLGDHRTTYVPLVFRRENLSTTIRKQTRIFFLQFLRRCSNLGTAYLSYITTQWWWNNLGISMTVRPSLPWITNLSGGKLALKPAGEGPVESTGVKLSTLAWSVITFGPRGNTESILGLACRSYTVHVSLIPLIPECSAVCLGASIRTACSLKDITIT